MNNLQMSQNTNCSKTTSSYELTDGYKQLKNILFKYTTDKNRKLTKARGVKITKLLEDTNKLLRYFIVKRGLTENSKFIIQPDEVIESGLNSDESLIKGMLDDFDQVESVERQKDFQIDNQNIVINETIHNKTINIDTTEKFINIILPGYSCQITINTKC